ncbi:MAG: exosortase/archaeosortase family protein [Candidatus Micrarchaeota archaeon]
MKKKAKSAGTELEKGLKFLLGIGAFYTLFWLVLSSLDLYALKSGIARAAGWLLSVLGVPYTLSFGAEPSILVGNVSAQITNLCAGDIEIALLMAIILATWDRTLRQKLWGCVFGFFTILILNPLRIAIVLAVGHYNSWQWADFAHSVLFRAMLLFIIIVYYFVWYVKYESVRKWILKKWVPEKRVAGKAKKKTKRKDSRSSRRW